MSLVAAGADGAGGTWSDATCLVQRERGLSRCTLCCAKRCESASAKIVHDFWRSKAGRRLPTTLSVSASRPKTGRWVVDMSDSNPGFGREVPTLLTFDP